jgi:hypothetical protein
MKNQTQIERNNKSPLPAAQSEGNLRLIPLVDMDYLKDHDPRNIAQMLGARDLSKEETTRFLANPHRPTVVVLWEE